MFQEFYLKDNTSSNTKKPKSMGDQPPYPTMLTPPGGRQNLYTDIIQGQHLILD